MSQLPVSNHVVQIELGQTGMMRTEMWRRPDVEAIGAVVLTHGKAHNASTWKELGVVDRLLSHNLLVVGIDIPGEQYDISRSRPDVSLTASKLVTLAVERHEIMPNATGVFASLGAKEVGFDLMASTSVFEKIVLIAPVGVEGLAAPSEQQRLGRPEALIIWGSDDEWTDPKDATLLANQFDRAQVSIVKGARHPLTSFPADTLATQIADFALNN